MGAVITEKARQLIEDVKLILSDDKLVSIKIETVEQYEWSGEMIKKLKIRKSQVEIEKEEECKPKYVEWKDLLAEFTPTIEKLEEKIKAFEQGGRDFRRLEEQKAIELQRKYEAEAEAVRKLIEDQAGTNAEKATKLREKAIELRAMAASGCTAEDATRYENEARKYDNRALKYEEKVEIKMQQAAQTVAPIVAPVIPKNTKGAFDVRTYYGYRIIDKKKFVEDCIKKNHLERVIEDSQILSALARANKGNSDIDGVVFYVK